MIRALWSCKWGLTRLALAAIVLWAVLADAGPRLARLGLASLPDFDAPAEINALRAQGRFGEAVMIGEAALDTPAARADPAKAAAITAALQAARDEQSSWLRRARDVGQGALTGQGRTLEGLLGAVTADMLLVGDIRDLVIQGTRLALDGEADPVITALSALGIALTVAPEVDWGASVLKIARKSGALAGGLADEIVALARRGSRTRLEGVAKDTHTLMAASGPAGAVRVLRSVRSTDELAQVASFVSRRGKAGAAALHIGGDDAVRWIAKGQDEAVLIAASRKGPAGVAYAQRPSTLALLARPHPLLGLTKSLYKGNLTTLAQRLVDALGSAAWWLLPLAAAWATLELWLLGRRLAANRQGTQRSEPVSLSAV